MLITASWSRTTCILYYSGYDPQWYTVQCHDHTPWAEAIKLAISTRLKTVTLSPGNVVFKTRWSPRELQMHFAYEQRDRLRSAIRTRRAYVTAVIGRRDCGRMGRYNARMIERRIDRPLGAEITPRISSSGRHRRLRRASVIASTTARAIRRPAKVANSAGLRAEEPATLARWLEKNRPRLRQGNFCSMLRRSMDYHQPAACIIGLPANRTACSGMIGNARRRPA